MLGDSFCKVGLRVRTGELMNSFNPHAWGLFLQVENLNEQWRFWYQAFNPHAWGLFLQALLWCCENVPHDDLSIPMLGDSFCKLAPTTWYSPTGRLLSIPMLGDSFCKEHVQGFSCFKTDAFNPHAWGLFLQGATAGWSEWSVRSFNPHAWGLFLQECV